MFQRSLPSLSVFYTYGFKNFGLEVGRRCLSNLSLLCKAWFSLATQAQAQGTYADAVTCLLVLPFVSTKAANDQHVTASAYVPCAYACVASENQA